MVNNEKEEGSTKRNIKEIKISTTLYSINHCEKWKFTKAQLFGLW